jgi:hypothetical protein
VPPHGLVGAPDIPDMLRQDLLIIGLRSAAPDMPDLSDRRTAKAGAAMIIVSDCDV